jgi:restriction system protein
MVSDSFLPDGMRYESVTLSPKEFENEVEKLLITIGKGKLSQFKTNKLEKLMGSDGEYEIDITVRFEALGGKFLVLVECKHHKSPIKRDVVQVLNDRLRAVGAQKGMIFATTRFQKGAIEYAKQHGIALVQVADGKTSYFTKGAGETIYPPWLPSYVGWYITLNDEGNELHSLIFEDHIPNIFI